MASKSAPGLLSAIEGYSAEHSGSKEHEPNIALLKRVAAEIASGHGGDTISPGQKEASAAAQKNMPAEEGHDGGKGSVKTNEPGSARQGDAVAEPSSNSRGTQNMANAEVKDTDGHVTSNFPGPAARTGVLPDMRRQAALKELEKGPTSGGNNRSNPEQPFPPASKRIGDVETGGKSPADKNKGGDGFEGVPPFAKESLSGDGWSRANAKAKQMYAAKK